MLECVINISEGKNLQVLKQLAQSVENNLLDVHIDADHNRSVFTLHGLSAAKKLTETAISLLDISVHKGVHPRIGVVDVVPFVPLFDATMEDAIHARNSFALWASEKFSIPCFLYGDSIPSTRSEEGVLLQNGADDRVSNRTLPFIRKNGFATLSPDFGPDYPHPNAGSIAVGARNILIAYNIWFETDALSDIKQIASNVRGGPLRSLGLIVGNRKQVSLNLIEPEVCGPFEAFTLVREEAEKFGLHPIGAELVGLIPESVLHKIPQMHWDMLDICEEKTIEYRLDKGYEGILS